MRSLFYIITFFTITPLTIVATLFASNTLSNFDKTANSLASPYSTHISAYTTPKYGSQVFAALPSVTGKVQGFATANDARVEIIRQYLINYNSPLEPFAFNIVEISDKYDLDFRLLTAIAQQESNLCKKIPPETFNCWGWGIHEKGTLGFGSYTEAMEAVAKGLREEYLNKGYRTPDDIMKKYTPMSSGSWARGVNQFLSDME